MKRLRDEMDVADLEMAAARRLVSQVPPLGPSEMRALRVRRAIERRASGGPARLRVFFVRGRGAAAFAFGLVVVATAGATLGVVEWVKGSGEAESLDARGLSHDSANGAAPRVGKAGVGETGRTETGRLEESPSPAVVVPLQLPGSGTQGVKDEPVVEEKGSDQTATLTHTKPAGAASKPSTGKEPSGVASEARLVQEAVSALRSGGDADKAERLLSEYHKSASSGQLDEEALALSIEVALSKKDRRAEIYARRYLAQYPNGRFKSVALRALAR